MSFADRNKKIEEKKEMKKKGVYCMYASIDNYMYLYI
jgi:hypothetical protein